jgi:hypothetical protein
MTIVSEASLREWSESPRTLLEGLAWQAVETGSAPSRGIDWAGPQKEPFLSLQARGGVKLESVIRGKDGNVTLHFWQVAETLPSGVHGPRRLLPERTWLKVKTTKPSLKTAKKSKKKRRKGA